MSQPLRFASNEAGEVQVAAHLHDCDVVFVPPLSGRVNIADYARKIVAQGQRFEAWSGDILVGLLAVYCNAPDKHAAFISNVSVVPNWQGQKIAARLLGDCIAQVRELGFACIELNVDEDNPAAVSLYKKYGFMRSGATRHPMIMTLDLGKDT